MKINQNAGRYWNTSGRCVNVAACVWGPFPPCCVQVFLLLQKNRSCPEVTSDDLGTPSKGYRWYFSVKLPIGTCNIIILTILSGLGSIQRKLKFLPLTYNGEVVKLTWPQVTDIKNPRYTFCRYYHPHQLLKLLYRSLNSCSFGASSNFWWGWVTQSDLVTWPWVTWC